MKYKLLDFIINSVCELYQIDTDILYIKTRKREIVQARQIVFYFLRKYKYGSLTEVGFVFNKDHATVLHSCKTVENLRVYPDFNNQINKLDKNISKFNKKLHKQDFFVSAQIAIKEAKKFNQASGNVYSWKELKVVVRYILQS